MKLNSVLPIAAAAVGIAITTAVNPASAFTIGFNNIPNGDTAGDSLVSNFQVQVTDNSSNVSNTVLFKILNNLAPGSLAANAGTFIRSVHFASGSLLSNFTPNVNNTGFVSFDVSNSLNFPQGNNVPGGFIQVFAADRATGGQQLSNNAGGIQAGEALGVRFTGNYNSVIAALTNGTLKVGIHVQALPGGGSDSFVTNPNPVPEPFTIVGSGVALGVGAMMRKKQQKKKAIAKTDA